MLQRVTTDSKAFELRSPRRVLPRHAWVFAWLVMGSALWGEAFPADWRFVRPFAASAVAAAEDNGLSAEEKAEGFVAMFNGKDLAGWRFDAGPSPPAELPPNWKVEEGVIKVTGGGKPHLATAVDYGDFEMRFEWRGMRDKYNSGFFVRSGKQVGANQINLAKGAEGAFIGGKIQGAKAVPELQNAPGEWNEWRVRVVGDKVTFWCNGKMAWEATGLASARGYIGLQAEGAPMEFRKLRIREIKP